MISVLVVDDSAVIRRLITDALAEDPEIRVVGTAANGQLALNKIDQLKPDLITLDIEMPVLDGLGTLRQLRPRYPRLPVIMFSTLTAAGASATLDALTAGASDYVTKPSNVGNFDEALRRVREQIIPRIHALCGRRKEARQNPNGFAFPPALPGLAGIGHPPAPPASGAGVAGRAPARPGAPARGRGPATGPAGPAVPGTAPAAAAAPARVRARGDKFDVLAIGCSTGGPDALSKVLKDLPGTLAVPIVVVQHMPPVFTKMFAERLDRSCALRVVEAAGDEPVRPGTVYIAPGDFHLEVVALCGDRPATPVRAGGRTCRTSRLTAIRPGIYGCDSIPPVSHLSCTG